MKEWGLIKFIKWQRFRRVAHVIGMANTETTRKKMECKQSGKRSVRTKFLIWMDLLEEDLRGVKFTGWSVKIMDRKLRTTFVELTKKLTQVFKSKEKKWKNKRIFIVWCSTDLLTSLNLLSLGTEFVRAWIIFHLYSI